MNDRLPLLGLVAAALALPACSSDNEALLTDAEYEEQAVVTVKEVVQQNLDAFHAATVALQAAAPAPDADGWNATDDQAAVDAMKAEWKEARVAYETVEGAIAVVFPDLDYSTDARYEDYIEVAADTNAFDGEGVTGVHAIERILWSDSISASVLAFEEPLPNYTPAAFPATEEEAAAFKDELCARLVADAQAMREGFRSLALDAPAAYRGVIGSMEEQVEKILKAETGQEESRYAQFTLGDMRANLTGARTTYQAFQSWVLSKGDAGAAADAAIVEGFERIQAGYDAVEGDSLPPVPDGWTSGNPTPEQLETPFGQLFELVAQESDPDAEGSLVHEMQESATLLGVEPLP